jgi:hypothetical protein
MINDDVLDLSIFTESHDDDEGFYVNIEKHLNDVGIEFPSFITFEEVKPLHEISWTAAGYAATGIEGNWPHIEELYDHIERELQHDASFHKSIIGSPDVEDDLGGMVFLKDAEGRGSSRMLIGPVNKRQMSVYKYYGFLKTAKAWLAKQDDLLLAYSFLELHPAFWSRSASQIERHPHEWKMESGLGSLWTGLSRKDDGENVIMFEIGAAVEPARVMHYHDTRLDVWAPTFENAYVQLAQKVHQYFYLDGDSRPDAPYTPQDWEVEVADRLDKWKESNAKWEESQASTEIIEDHVETSEDTN